MRTRPHHASFVNALAFGMILAVVGYAGCDNGATTTGASTSVTITNGTGYHPACNGGVRDGFCNALGADPETCDCLDCVDTAFCKGGCKNDGVCNPSQGEDCTCADCVGKQVPDGNGGHITCYTPTSSAGPATTGGAGGNGTTAATTTNTTNATTATTNTTAATTTNTTAATTATTATTAASTSDSSSAAAGG